MVAKTKPLEEEDDQYKSLTTLTAPVCFAKANDFENYCDARLSIRRADCGHAWVNEEGDHRTGIEKCGDNHASKRQKSEPSKHTEDLKVQVEQREFDEPCTRSVYCRDDE